MTPYNLKFETNEPQDAGKPLLAYGSGPTLIQALAELERDLIRQFGVEADFGNNTAFTDRDIADMYYALSYVGGVFSCVDFSAYEDAFTITRLPNNPNANTSE